MEVIHLEDSRGQPEIKSDRAFVPPEGRCTRNMRKNEEGDGGTDR